MYALIATYWLAGCGGPSTPPPRTTSDTGVTRYSGPCRRPLAAWCEEHGYRRYLNCPSDVTVPRGGDRAHVRCIGENRNWRDQVFTGTWAWNDTFYFGPAGRLLAAVHGADHGLCVAEDPKDTGYYYGSYDFVVHYGRYPLYCDERCLVTGGSDYDHWWKHLKRCPDDL